MRHPSLYKEVAMIGKRLRQLERYREIATVLARHGFGFMLKEIGLSRMITLPANLLRKKNELEKISVGKRLRMALEDLGPTFIKLGQIASTRPDIIPMEIIRELEKLLDSVPSFSYAEAKEIVESELGAPISERFASFSETPLAAASIGQVHRAVLNSGEEVVVKIRRPHVQTQIETDLEILIDLAGLAEAHFAWAKTYQVQEMISEFAKSLRAELDYSKEGRNAEKMRKIFADDPFISVPAVFWEYSTKKILTLEYLEGINLNQYETLAEQGYQPKVIAERLVKSTFKQVLDKGYFHGDPHPGNILVLPDNKLAYLDFGMVGRLTPDMKYYFSSLVIALMRQSTDDLITAIMGMGLVPDEINLDGLYREVDELREKYTEVPLSKVSMGEAMIELFSVAFHHKIRIPSDLALLGKMFLTVEGTVEALDPELSILDIAKPFGQRILKERYGIPRFLKHIRQNINETVEILFGLPKQLKDFLKIMSKGRIALDINFTDKETLFKKIDRSANLMAFSILLLSVSIILASVIIASSLSGHGTFFSYFPVAVIGFFAVFVLIVWLIIWILRS